MLLRELLPHLEALAPLELAESWDNTGLLWGAREAEITRVLTCLTLTPDVAAEACEVGAELVVTHHPLLFKPVQRLTDATMEGRTLTKLARRGIAVYSPHTAWDNAPRGINRQLAELFELTAIRPLRPKSIDGGYKLLTFVPSSDLDAVRRALWEAGCGRIGDYDQCGFVTAGTGSFRGSEASRPTIGAAGRFEETPELRLEIVCPKVRLTAALAALRAAHSYEEPAVDVVPLEAVPSEAGAGRWGKLPTPLSLGELVTKARSRLGAPFAQYVGEPARVITTLGVACGAASDFWTDARNVGCEVLLTGETRFHTALEAREAGMALIVAGHDATERFAMANFAEWLIERCPGLQASASRVEADPLRG
jgi:dinuclear metal center YbgI/SA1388 family protein